MTDTEICAEGHDCPEGPGGVCCGHSTKRKQALEALLAKIEAGELPRPLPFPVSECSYIIAAFDGSLDAALALHEAVLPGWSWEGGTMSKSFSVYPPDYPGEDFESPCYSEEDSSPARALLMAIIKALIALETEKAVHPEGQTA